METKVMKAVIQAYKNEMLQWFEQGDVEAENPIKHGTQELWYSLYLEKKRLDNHRCKLQYKTYECVRRDGLIEGKHDLYQYHRDGKYTVCEANQMTQVEKLYIRDEVVLNREKKKRELIYYIIRSQNQNGQYICPNCGAEQELDKLLDGCDYCKSKFDISVYEDKVSSVTSSQGNFDDREKDGFKTYSTVTGAVCIGCGILAAPITCGISLVWAVYGAHVLSKARKSRTYNQAYESWQNHVLIKQKIKEYDPDFSEEEFIGALDCKLKSIHYASNMQELTAFVKCDVTPYINDYQDIISCEVGKIACKNFWVDEHYQYVELHRQIDVKKDNGRRLLNGTGFVAVTLAKKRSAMLKNEVSLYRCKCCGSSISLVEGGKCGYCGNEMDYAAYDWIIVGYRHVNVL